MTISKHKILTHIRDLILITVISFLIALFFSGGQQISWAWAGWAMLYSFLIGGSLWKGNELVGYLVEKKFTEIKNPGRFLRIEIAALVLFSIADIFLINYIWFGLIWGENFPDFIVHQKGWVILVIQFIVAFIIGLIFYVMEFFRVWKEYLKQEEEFKREKLLLQYEALKSQVNPHFLFNSLNTLSSLIFSDQDKADQFVRKLSSTYRYILEQKDKELVSLRKEMDFVRDYVSLQKIRFEDSLKVNIDLRNPNDRQVIPNSIQMLVENAIKHNVITKEQPLTIKIFLEGGHHLVVKNNLQKKKSIRADEEQKPDWVKIGLNNIKARYEYLTDKNFLVNDPENDVIIEDDRKHFIVKLPLI
ncbi:MAG: histidine kinase [Bacteroidales bacterium]|nr:histidine kinase [Bacteroidales bacterium]MCF8351749.1 histidine kinase [Bacteroidales bacterium]MCF8375147.1 histidine kinase [Bacteroidales bacterium]